MKLAKKITANVIRMRKEKGYSIAELSDKTGIGIANMYAIESGKHNITLDALEVFAKIYKIDVCDLICNE